MEGFTAHQASKFTACSPRQLRYWDQIGGMSLQRVRRSWAFLNKRAGLDRHLSEVQLVTDGQSIFKICRRDGEVMDALKEGQMAFFVAIDDIATSVDSNVRTFQDDRDRFVRALREAAAVTATGS